MKTSATTTHALLSLRAHAGYGATMRGFPIAMSITWLALVSCGAPQPSHTAKPVGGLSEVASEKGLQELLGGVTLDGAQLPALESPAIVIAFATWCGPCRKELALLSQLRLEFPKLRIVGLNAHEEYADYSNPEAMRSFVKSNAPWLLEIVRGSKSMRASFGGIPKIPSLFVYNSEGKIVSEFRRNRRSPPNLEELREAIAKAH